MKRIGIALMIMILSAALLTGCSGGGDGGEAGGKTVNIGYFNNVTHAQALHMKSQQTLENSLGEDVEVTWTAFNAGPAEVEAIFAGSIDIGYIGPVPAISANAKSDGDVKILTGATKGGAVLIARKDAGIKNIADLAGKSVAIPQIGNTQHLCLLDLLEKSGLAPDTEGGDVKVCAVANADVANTMERGDIDAALVPEPWGATLLNEDTEMVLDYDQVYMDGDYDVALVVVRKEFYEENPDIVEAFLNAHSQATNAINENREDALVIINEELKAATGKALSDDIISEAFTRIGVSEELNRDSIAGFAGISAAQEFIDEEPTEDSLYVE